MFTRLAYALPFLLALIPSLSWSADCGPPENLKRMESIALTGESDRAGYDNALSTIKACLGDPISDAHPLVVAFNKATPSTDAADTRVAAIAHALARLHDAARTRVQQGVDAQAWQQIASELGAELEATRSVAAQRGVHPIDNAFWTLPPTADATSTIANGAVRPLFTGCTKPPQPCAVYESRIELIRTMNLMDRLIGYAQYPDLEAHYADAKAMTARWDSYFNKALPQYWWEIAINGSRMGDDLCPKDATGMQLGFCAVPESQLIVLHPATGLQWVHGADDKDDLAPAFVVEVFGRNSWKWNRENMADAGLHGQFGWSIIAAYSNPDGDQKNWSYGIMLHKGSSLNFGVTTAGDGQYSVLVNINLAEMLFARKAEYLDYLKDLRKEPWQSLL